MHRYRQDWVEWLTGENESWPGGEEGRLQWLYRCCVQPINKVFEDEGHADIDKLRKYTSCTILTCSAV